MASIDLDTVDSAIHFAIMLNSVDSATHFAIMLNSVPLVSLAVALPLCKCHFSSSTSSTSQHYVVDDGNNYKRIERTKLSCRSV